MLSTTNYVAFVDTLADILRLPDETIAMAHVYLNKYFRHQNSDNNKSLFDSYTLSLACLSLASKVTENPRRMREILPPAHRLLQKRENGISDPLVIPSQRYDDLRSTLVQAELVLTRVLGFDLRLSLPLDYVPSYLRRALDDLAAAAEDYDSRSREDLAAYGVIGDVIDTALGRACITKAVDVCKEYRLINFFPARALALTCLHVTLRERGLMWSSSQAEFVSQISSRKVDVEDFGEILETMRHEQTIQ